MSILYVGFVASRRHHLGVVLRVVYRDGIVYFFVLFSSNLVWLLLLLYARVGIPEIPHLPALTDVGFTAGIKTRS